MFCLFSERSSPCHWLQKDRASLGGRGAERCGCRQFQQLPGCASGRGSLVSAAPLQMRRHFLSSAGFKPSQKGLKFLLSVRKSEVKGQESPTSTERVEHHRGAQFD